MESECRGSPNPSVYVCHMSQCQGAESLWLAEPPASQSRDCICQVRRVLKYATRSDF